MRLRRVPGGQADRGVAGAVAAVTGVAVTFAARIAGPDGDDWFAVALFTAALCVPPVLAAVTARETRRVPTERLGEGTRGKAAARPEKVTA